MFNDNVVETFIVKTLITNLAQEDFSRYTIKPDGNLINITRKTSSFLPFVGKKIDPDQFNQGLNNLANLINKFPELLEDKDIQQQLPQLTDKLKNQVKEIKGTEQQKEEALKKIDSIALLLKPFQDEANAAASKIQGLVRGHQTRKKIVLPSQITPKLESNLIDKTYAEEIGKILSREISTMTMNPEKYKGKSKYLTLNNKEPYTFPIFDDNKRVGTQQFFLHNVCILELSQDGKQVIVSINPKEDTMLGQGTYATVYGAQSFTVPLSFQKEGGRKVEYAPFAVLTPRSSDKKSFAQTKMTEGLAIHKKALQIEGCKVTSLPYYPLPNADADTSFSPKQEWYNSDLWKAFSTRAIPLDISKDTERHPFSLKDTLNVLEDAAKSLHKMHEVGLVHRDIKPPNILVKLKENHQTEGYLHDFDFATLAGMCEYFEGNYFFWDFASNRGLASSFTDVYGLAMSLGMVTIPNFTELFSQSQIMKDLATFNQILDQSLEKHLQNLVNKYPAFQLVQGSTPSTTTNPFENKINLINTLMEYSLPQETKELLKAFQKDLKAMSIAADYIAELIKKNREIHDFFILDPEMMTLLQSSKEEDRAKVNQKLEETFPSCSIARYLEVLNDIRASMTS